jgi:hypothetical protein
MPKIPAYSDEPDSDEDIAENENVAVATLPKSILQGKTFEVGDRVTLKITAIRDGEVDVEYGSEAEEEPPVGEPAAEETAEEGEEGAGEIVPPEAPAGPPAYE